MSLLVSHPVASAAAVTVLAFAVALASIAGPDVRWRRRQSRRRGYIRGTR